MKRTAAALVGGSAILAALLTASQVRFPESSFEFDTYRSYSGVIRHTPYPLLDTGSSRYLLVNPGKHGATVAPYTGQVVTLEGSRIWRDGVQMLELKPETIRLTGALAPQIRQHALGRVRLRGEVVDSKCYLGVMNPGEGKVHRACAARCIAGGVPPMLVVRAGSGIRRVLLASADGKPLTNELIPFAGETVEIDGDLEGVAGETVLRADTSTYCRVE
jgi:hypothetical protein